MSCWCYDYLRHSADNLYQICQATISGAKYRTSTKNYCTGVIVGAQISEVVNYNFTRRTDSVTVGCNTKHKRLLVGANQN